MGCVVLTGSEKAFAAGADIKEMKDQTFSTAFMGDMLAHWEAAIQKSAKPIIAAVNGYALGGGCELAMMCDIVYAGSEAKFGQPEITIGTIPGCGGTQRLARAVGKSRAMELILTGEFMGAEEALQRGLVSKVFAADLLVGEALKTARRIAQMSPLAVKLAKEAVNESYEVPLRSGVKLERRLFHATFATVSQKPPNSLGRPEGRNGRLRGKAEARL